MSVVKQVQTGKFDLCLLKTNNSYYVRYNNFYSVQFNDYNDASEVFDTILNKDVN